MLKVFKRTWIVKNVANREKLTRRMRNTVFTSSTCSVVNGPPYLDLPRSSLEGSYVLLPVGESTAVERSLVLSSEFYYLIESFKRVRTLWFNY